MNNEMKMTLLVVGTLVLAAVTVWNAIAIHNQLNPSTAPQK